MGTSRKELLGAWTYPALPVSAGDVISLSEWGKYPAGGEVMGRASQQESGRRACSFFLIVRLRPLPSPVQEVGVQWLGNRHAEHLPGPGRRSPISHLALRLFAEDGFVFHPAPRICSCPGKPLHYSVSESLPVTADAAVAIFKTFFQAYSRVMS